MNTPVEQDSEADARRRVAVIVAHPAVACVEAREARFF